MIFNTGYNQWLCILLLHVWLVMFISISIISINYNFDNSSLLWPSDLRSAAAELCNAKRSPSHMCSLEVKAAAVVLWNRFGGPEKPALWKSHDNREAAWKNGRGGLVFQANFQLNFLIANSFPKITAIICRLTLASDAYVMAQQFQTLSFRIIISFGVITPCRRSFWFEQARQPVALSAIHRRRAGGAISETNESGRWFVAGASRRSWSKSFGSFQKLRFRFHLRFWLTQMSDTFESKIAKLLRMVGGRFGRAGGALWAAPRKQRWRMCNCENFEVSASSYKWFSALILN